MRAAEPSDANRTGTHAAAEKADWPAQAAEQIERAVHAVRDKTTGPAITAARWIVASMFLIVAGTALLVLLVIATVRALDAYLPSSVFGDSHVWAAHTVVGLPLFVGGLILMGKRRKPAVEV